MSLLSGERASHPPENVSLIVVGSFQVDVSQSFSSLSAPVTTCLPSPEIANANLGGYVP